MDGKEFDGGARSFVTKYHEYEAKCFDDEAEFTYFRYIVGNFQEKLERLERENNALRQNHPDRLLRKYCRQLQNFIHETLHM